VLRSVDAAMPSSVQYLPFFPQLKVMLSNGVYSQVFGPLGAASGIGLPPANSAVDAPSAAITTAESSVVKVTGTAASCSQDIEGSGFVISSQHVLTNAHVVAGVNQNLLVTASNGRQYANVRVVLYDPDTDLAVLYVPQLTAPPLKFASQTGSAQAGAVAGYPQNDPLHVVPASIGESFTATGPNIYQDQTVHRQMYEIRAQIEPGNSGGPLLSADGQVYGVVFAKSTYLSNIGYALTASEVDSDADAGGRDYAAVSTQGCQDG
jgi:S1-C subfamily serine protease